MYTRSPSIGPAVISSSCAPTDLHFWESPALHPVNRYLETVDRGPVISPSPSEAVQCTRISKPAISAVIVPPSVVNGIGRLLPEATNSSTGEAALAPAGTSS